MQKPVATWGAGTLARVRPELHPLVTAGAFGPPARASFLIWPEEAPPPSAAVTALFAGLRLEPGNTSATSAAAGTS